MKLHKLLVLITLLIISLLIFSNIKVYATEQYKGFDVIGQIEIPKINLSYPILRQSSADALSTSVVFVYGTELNSVGNCVIAGHNYRNGEFFSDLDKLNVGDLIYITDLNNQKITYTIYNKFEVSLEDTSFYQRDTNGLKEITLTTSTDTSDARLIILAKETTEIENNNPTNNKVENETPVVTSNNTDNKVSTNNIQNDNSKSKSNSLPAAGIKTVGYIILIFLLIIIFLSFKLRKYKNIK